MPASIEIHGADVFDERRAEALSRQKDGQVGDEMIAIFDESTRRLHRTKLDQSVASPSARRIQLFLFWEGGGGKVGEPREKDGGNEKVGKRMERRFLLEIAADTQNKDGGGPLGLNTFS